MGASRLTPRRAVFLDRDGVLNYNIHNPSTGAFEAPLTPAQFQLIPGVINRACGASGGRIPALPGLEPARLCQGQK